MDSTLDKRKQFIFKISENYFNKHWEKLKSVDQIFEVNSFLDKPNCSLLCLYSEGPDLRIKNQLPEANECQVVLVFYKIRPEVVDENNVQNIILICSIGKSPMTTLYQTLQKIFIPAFLKDQPDGTTNVKLQTLITDLEAGLKSAVLKNDYLSKTPNHKEHSLSGILSLQDECDYWNFISTTGDSEECIMAQNFLQILRPISARMSHLIKLMDLGDLLEDIYNAFDDIWKLDQYRYSQKRMHNLLEITGNEICQFTQDCFKDYCIWKNEYYECVELLTLAVEACNKWIDMCNQLTNFFWPNYSLHQWSGQPFSSAYSKEFVIRLNQIIKIRTVQQNLQQILSEKEQKQLNIENNFTAFSGINPLLISSYSITTWNVAVQQFEENLKPLEKQVGNRLKEEIRTISCNTLQLLEWFKRYQDLIQLSDLKVILKPERQTLLMMCQEYVNNLFTLDLSSSKLIEESKLVYEFSDVPLTVANMMGIQQFQAKINEMQSICGKITCDLNGYETLYQSIISIKEELQTSRLRVYNQWSTNTLSMVNTNQLSLKTDEAVVYFEEGKSMTVNYNSQLVRLIKEVRYLKLLKFNISPIITDVTELAEKFVKQAKALEQIANFHNTIGDRMIPSQRPMMLNTALELSTLVKTQHTVTWSEINAVEKYIEKLQTIVEKLATENTILYSYHDRIMQKVIILMATDLIQQKNKWRDTLREIREIITEVEKRFSNTRSWRVHWDYQLYKALECQYQIGLEHLNHYLPEIKVELVYRQQSLHFSPPIEEIRVKYYNQLKKFLTIPCSFQGVSNSSESIFPKMVENNQHKYKDVYEKGELLFDRLFALRDEWLDKVALGSVDMDRMIQENLKTADDWDMNFRDSKAWGQEIAKIVSCEHKIDCFVVSTAPVRSEIELHNHRYWDALATSLYSSIMSDVALVNKFMDESGKTLAYEPQTLVEIGDMNNAYSKIIQSSRQISEMINEIDQKNKTLASWTKERVATVQEVKQAWIRFQASVENQQHVISRQVESMKSNVLTELENLMTEMDNFILRWKQMRPRETDIIDENVIDIDRILNLLHEKRTEWNSLSLNIDKIRQDCNRFSIRVSELPDQISIENDLKQCEELWKLYNDFISATKQLGSEEWIVFRSKGIQQFEKFLQEWQNKLEVKTASPLVAKLLKDLQSYKDFIPCIKFIRGDSFSEKHWSELFSALGMNSKPVDKLIFGDFLSIRESIKQNMSYLQELNNRAASEIVVRQALAELDIWEVEAKFTFIPHTDVNGQEILLVKDFKDLLAKVGDNQCLLQSIVGSSNYDQFSDRIKLWETRLDDVDYCLRSISELQRKWLYLEPIFGSETVTIEKSRFSRVDKDLRHVLSSISSGDRRVIGLCRNPNLKQILQSSLYQLNICQKNLNDYLEDKRLKFPRFYFLSDDDLLEILGQANKPEIVQSHLKKIFAAIHSVTFDDDYNIVCMKSLEGETVTLRSPIAISLDVEQWLENLVHEMRRTLQELLTSCLKGADPLLFPSQILCLAEEISFTTRCERAIETSGLKQLRLSLEKQLQTYTLLNLEWSSDKEFAVLEIKLKALILDTIYHMSVVDDLISNCVTSLSDWHWQRRIRHYLKSDGVVIIKMVDAEFTYSYEYQGNAPKLVHTPLTDKCYLTLTQAMHMGLGGNPYGPAGTGKTESVKALGRLLGRQVLVFNCDEGLDFHSLARILIGLIKCGAWGCFDEFNRLEEATLSAISTNIFAIQESLKNDRTTVTLLGKEIHLDKNTGIFVTLNPAGRGYGGRQKLPDNLKQLFRPVSMSQPDDQLIAEVILYSEGFKSATVLAIKLVQIFDMCKRILSKQKHYDWGLRALKTVIGGCRSALKVARKNCSGGSELDEFALIVEVTRLNTLSKLTFSDANQFDKLVQDVFPGIVFKSYGYDKIWDAVKQSFSLLGLTPNERQIHKCLELYEQLQQRMGVVVVGPPGAGKSVICRLLKQALVLLDYKINQYTINPKSMARTQLLGQIDIDTRRWIDGVLSTTAQKVYNEQSDVQSWIVFDGDVDPEWIESLNSVLDDNRLLTLPSGWRIQFGPNVHLIFETDNLDNASPATVSRMGIVLLSEDDVDIKNVVNSWLERLSNSQQSFLSQNIEDYMYKALNWIKIKGEIIVYCSVIAAVNNFLSLLTDVSSKSHFAMMLIVGLGSNLTPASKQLFANEVLKWTGEFVQENYDVLRCYYNSDRDCIDLHTGDSHIIEQSTVVLTSQMKSVSEIIYSWIDKKEPFLLIGPPGCGKSVLLNNCASKLCTSEMVTVHCSSAISPYHILQKLSQVCIWVTSKNGRIFRPKNSERLILHLKDLNLTKIDKWGSSMLVSFLQQVISYGGFYDNAEMEWITMEEIHIIATLTSCESLSPRLVNLNRVIFLWPSDKDDLKSLSFAYIRSLLTDDGRLPTLLSAIIVEIYVKVKDRFTQEHQMHYVFTPRDLIHWSVGIRRYMTDKSLEETLESVMYEASRLFEDRLSTDEDKIQFQNIVKSVLETIPGQSTSMLNNINDSVFVWSENLTESFLQKLAVKEWILVLQKCITQLEHDGEYVDKKILLPELAKMVAYTEHTLTSCESSSSLIMPGRCGSGRKTAVRIVAARTSARLIYPQISYDYSLMNFKNDMKSILQMVGIENHTVYYMLEDYQLVLPEMLEYISSLLATGEIPELYQLEEFETLCAPLRDVVTQSDFNGTPCQYFTQRVIKNLRVILILDFTNPSFKTYFQTNPVLLKKCNIIWWSNWHSETMESIPSTISSCNLEVEEKDLIEKSVTTLEDDVLRIAIYFHESSETRMNVTPRHFNLFIKSYIKIKEHKQHDIISTLSKLKAGLSKLTDAKSVVADLKSDAAQQEIKLAEKQNKATTALELITKTMQNASTQKNEMEILKENVERENVALTLRKKEIDAELAEIEPLITQSRQAVGNIKSEALTEIRSLRAPPEVIRDILEGVLRLMGIQDTSWNSMKTFLSKRGVKEDIRCFDARNITTENRQCVEQLLQTNSRSFEEKTAKRASTAAAPLATWIIANVKYSEILEKIVPLEKEQIKLQNKLKDAEDQITLLSTGLDNVDQTVSKLKEQLNVNTKEAAEIEVHLNKAKETIFSAENLVIKLNEEYSRWGEQITELSKSLEKLPFCCLLAAASIIYLSGTTEETRNSVLKEWQQKIGIDFSLQTFLSTEQEQMKWISGGLSSDCLSLQNAVIIAQVIKLDVTTCNRLLLMDPTSNAINWLKQDLLSQKTVEYTTQHHSRFATTLELAIRFGKVLIIQEVTSVNPILVPVLQGNFIHQGTRKLIQVGEKIVDYNNNFQLVLWCRDTKCDIPPNVLALLTTVNFATTHTSLSQQLLRCSLSIENPELEKKQMQLLKREEELKLDLYNLQDNILKELANARGNILDNKDLLSSLNETKKGSLEIKAALSESEQIKEKLAQECDTYKPLAEDAAKLFFSFQSLQEINRLYQISVSSFVEIYSKIFCAQENNEESDSKKRKLINLVYQHVSRFLFRCDRLTFALYLTRVIYPQQFGNNEWELFTRQTATDINFDSSNSSSLLPNWINKERIFDVILLKETLPELYKMLKLENSTKWDFISKREFDFASFPVSLSSFQTVLVTQALNPGLLHSALTKFSLNALGLNALSPPPLRLDQLLMETSSTVPILLITSPGADPSEELHTLAVSVMSSKFYEISSSQGQTTLASQMLLESSKNGSWLILKNLHLVTSWIPTLEKEFQSLTDIHPEFRLWLTSEAHSKFPSELTQLCLKITYEAPQGLKRNLQRTYSQLIKTPQFPSTEYARTVFTLAWFHAVLQERRTFIPQGWRKFYEFNDSDLLTSLNIIQNMFTRGNKSVNWDYVHGLCENAIYGGRIDNEQDLLILKSYLRCYFNADVINSGRKRLIDDISLPTSLHLKDYLSVIQKLSDTDAPHLFSLPLNVDCFWQQIRSNEIINTVKVLCQGATKINSDDVQTWKFTLSPILHLWKQLNQEVGILKMKNVIKPKKQLGDENLMNLFLNDELQFAFTLVQHIHKSLVDINRILRSACMINETTKKLITSILIHQTPENWLIQWDGSSNPTTYIRTVMNKTSCIIALNKNAENGNSILNGLVDLSGFFNAQTFLSVLKQHTARTCHEPLDNLILECLWTDNNVKDVQNSVRITGLLVEGGYFDTYTLSENMPNSPSVSRVPSFNLFWIPKNRTASSKYEGSLPITVYQNSSRENILTLINVPVPFHEHDKWIQASVAFYLRD